MHHSPQFYPHETLIRSNRLPAFVLSLFALTAHADIYKSVGPDGKVSYSDRPPSNAASSVVQKPSAATAAQPASPAAPAKAPTTQSDATTAVPSLHAPKKAIRAAPPAAPVVQQIDPELQSAVIGVLGIEDLVKKTEDLCLGALPTSFKRYFGATDDWRRRNASFVAKAHYVLNTQFDATSRRVVESGVDQRNVGVFSKVASATLASKINWCDRSTDEIKAGTMDFRNKDKLASPLMKIPDR